MNLGLALLVSCGVMTRGRTYPPINSPIASESEASKSLLLTFSTEAEANYLLNPIGSMSRSSQN